jgi:hypothetical protein
MALAEKVDLDLESESDLLRLLPKSSLRSTHSIHLSAGPARFQPNFHILPQRFRGDFELLICSLC